MKLRKITRKPERQWNVPTFNDACYIRLCDRRASAPGCRAADASWFLPSCLHRATSTVLR